jgi:hypothetical protein
MTHLQKYYYREAMKQIRVSLIMIWHGVILNKGHHSQWRKRNGRN